MINFKIEKNQIARLKILMDYLRKMDSFSPITNEQTFIIKSNKLNIYGESNSGHAEATFDIISKITARVMFKMQLQQFISFLEKINSDEVNISIDKDVLSVSNSNTKIKHALINNNTLTDDIADELETWITTKLALNEFKKPITVNLAHKDKMIEFCNLTKFQDTNYQIVVGKNYIKVADVLSIITYTSKEQISSQDEVYIDRNIVSLFKNIDSFQISSDKQLYYFDFANNGVKLMFTPKTYNWQYPTDEDIEQIVPSDDKVYNLEVNTEKFYETIEKFEGVFDPSNWKYNQIKLFTPLDFETNKKLEFKWENLSTEIHDVLNVDIKDNTDTEDNFEFIFSSLYFKYLKDILISEPTFKLSYSSSPIDAELDMAMVIENSNLKVILAKLLP